MFEGTGKQVCTLINLFLAFFLSETVCVFEGTGKQVCISIKSFPSLFYRPESGKATT